VDRLIAGAGLAVDALELAANFDREYDDHGAIVTIHAGAGGVDAADWAQMLARMYLRWADAKGFSAQVAEESPAEEAGLKSITFFVRGHNAYGLLESERGVHRLVRISPFDQQHRRHTSFASVDVIPEIESGEATDVEIKPEDLRVETFKAGGAGGQYVNKTESAIRIVHLPTGLIVASQQERSQIQNRDVAMNILRAKLVQRAIEERESKLEELRGERRANEWGSQIRSYVLQPYTMVKDHRTNVESGNASAVLEGEIDGFIWPYLQQRRRAAS
jgi:peptide chain release factor 2